jgi:hypothetical protein
MKPRRCAPRLGRTRTASWSQEKARRHRANTCARASRQVLARFRPRPGRTRQIAASPFRSIAVIAGAARTSIPLHSEVVKADETGRAQWCQPARWPVLQAPRRCAARGGEPLLRCGFA